MKYEYNANDKLTKVTDWNNRVTTYAYDSRNRLTTTTRPDGSVETVTYDNGDQPLTVVDKDKNGTVINQYSYTYDANGNVTSENDNEDAASLLTPRATGDTNMTYGADNKLDTYNGTKVQYDADGNMLQGPLKGSMTSFSYDSKNRVTQAGTTTYGYDAEDNRISHTDNGKTTKYVINPEADMSQVLVRTDSDGKSTYYIYGLGLIGEEQQDGSYFSYHFDRRGSTTAITDINGNVTDKYIYGPYGEMVSHSGNSTTPFMFNGKDGVMTDSNGLYYMRSRYYNPDIKRFINMDVVRGSLSDGRTMNRYAYANGNPVSMVDPFGTSAKSDQADYLMKVVAPKLIQEQNSLYDSMNMMMKMSLTCAVLCPSLSPWIGVTMEAVNIVTAAMDAMISGVFMEASLLYLGSKQQGNAMIAGSMSLYYGLNGVFSMLYMGAGRERPEMVPEGESKRKPLEPDRLKEEPDAESEYTTKAINIYDPKFAAQQLLKNGKVTVDDLKSIIPKGILNTFKPTDTIKEGFKYNFTINDTKVEIKWHSEDLNAAEKYPGCNSGDGWTAQIKIGNKYLGQDGVFYKKQDNITHIPIN